MVEANADPEVVTSRIKRETRNAAAEREQEAAMAVESPVIAVESSAAGTLAVETVPPEPPPPPVDPDTAFRRGRLGVVAVIVLVLFWAWLRQRRAQ